MIFAIVKRVDNSPESVGRQQYSRYLNALILKFFYKEPTSRPSSKSSLFVGLKSANCSTKSSLIVP